MEPLLHFLKLQTSIPLMENTNVQPWEKSMLAEIEKAILIANLGFNPMNNGESIIINIPALTEERRKELAKLAKAEVKMLRFLFVQQEKMLILKLKNLMLLKMFKKIMK